MNVFLLSVASELARRGLQVDLLTRAEGAPTSTELAEGVILRELRAGPPGVIGKNSLVDAMDEFGEGVADLASRRDLGYSVIHAHYWLSGIATLPVALASGIPFVQNFHTLGAMKNQSLALDQEPEPELRLKSEMFLAGQASAIIAASAAEASALIDEARAPASRIWVIPPGVDIATFTPDRSPAADASWRLRLGLQPEQPILVVAGRIQPLKGQDLAIRMMASAAVTAHSGPRHLSAAALREDALLSGVGTTAAQTVAAGRHPVLVIAGEATPGDDDYLFSLHSLVESLGLGARVHFVGALDRVMLADLLAAATVVLLPSHSETFGLVALEAAASGTPVIGFRTSGHTDAVDDGRSGVLLGTRDPELWGAAVVNLLEHPGLHARYSRQARHHAEGYTWGATAAALLGVYASVGPALSD